MQVGIEMAFDLGFFEVLLEKDNKKKIKREIEKLVSQNFDLEQKVAALSEERSELNSLFEDAKGQVMDLTANNSSLEERYGRKSAKAKELLSKLASLRISISETKKALKKEEKENKALKKKLRIFQAMAMSKEQVDLDVED